MRTNRPPLLPRDAYVGPRRYFLTFCTDRRARHFLDADVVGLALAQFLRVGHAEGFTLLAYCFMPDHVHVLVEGTTADSHLRRFIKLSKQCSGHAFGRAKGGRRLWQPFAFEHTLRYDADVPRVVRYILENPVRAGLVTSPQDYPFAGSGTYQMAETLDAAAWQPPRRGRGRT